MSLYETLGVDSKANQTEIKNAYRNKAKKLHPDIGGDKEEFALIAIAYGILSDSNKRDWYDKTGIERDISFANQKAFGLLQNIFNTILDKAGVEGILTFNVIKHMEDTIRLTLEKDIKNKKKAVITKKALQKAARRIKHKKKLNAFSLVIKHKIDQLDKTIQAISEMIESSKIAKKMLKDYDFKFDIKEVTKSYSTWTATI